MNAAGLVSDGPVLLEGERESVGTLSDVSRHLVVEARQSAVRIDGAAKGDALAGPGADRDADGGDTLGGIAVGAGVVVLDDDGDDLGRAVALDRSGLDVRRAEVAGVGLLLDGELFLQFGSAACNDLFGLGALFEAEARVEGGDGTADGADGLGGTGRGLRGGLDLVGSALVKLEGFGSGVGGLVYRSSTGGGTGLGSACPYNEIGYIWKRSRQLP